MRDLLAQYCISWQQDLMIISGFTDIVGFDCFILRLSRLLRRFRVQPRSKEGGPSMILILENLLEGGNSAMSIWPEKRL